MTKRENLLAMLNKQPYKEIPMDFGLSPGLVEVFKQQTGSDLDYMDYYGMPWKPAFGPISYVKHDGFEKYYPFTLKPGTEFNIFGVAHEPGSAAALHMKRMHHPLKDADSPAVYDEYPFPAFDTQNGGGHIQKSVQEIKAKGLVAVGYMQGTIWETAWAVRSMEELMADMLDENEMAEKLFDIVTETAKQQAALFTAAGVDILYLGDDIGMQRTPMMGMDMYITWLKPRLKQVIDTARAINPHVLVFYHSCGFITPFIPHLIEIGIDALHPVQPECMAFEEIYKDFGDKLNFHGTIGTQSTFPLGTPDEMRAVIFRNLDLTDGGKGLYIAPTHLLEPDVPWENIAAYVDACREYGGKL